MGQGYHRASAAAREDAPFKDHESLRKVVTVRGRTGAALSHTNAPHRNLLQRRALPR
jgi:hypothetical protein